MSSAVTVSIGFGNGSFFTSSLWNGFSLIGDLAIIGGVVSFGFSTGLG